MDLGLAGKTALILGAGGGLGGAIAATLASEGARVALADLNAPAARENAEAITAAGGTAIALGWDLADLGIIEDRLAEIDSRLGPIDVLVSLTGGPPPGPIAGQSPAVWEQHFNAMILSVIAITDRVLPNMRARGWGRIITSATSGVIAPIPNLGLSNALRSALVGWSKTLAAEVAKDGITANIVLPGRIATPRIAFLDAKKAEREHRPVAEIEAESLRAIPAGRYGDPQEYADVVAFLASTRASYVTGSMIRVDGGYLANV